MCKRSESAAALERLTAAADRLLKVKLPPPPPSRLAAAIGGVAKIYDQAAERPKS